QGAADQTRSPSRRWRFDMNTQTFPAGARRWDPGWLDPARMLGGATGAWFALAAAGQLLMAAYVASFYGRALLAGTPARWNDGPMSHAHVAGEGVGNMVMGLHLGFTVVIVLAGLMQL